MEVGRWEVGDWRLEAGGCRLEVGSWRLEVGGWRSPKSITTTTIFGGLLQGWKWQVGGKESLSPLSHIEKAYSEGR